MTAAATERVGRYQILDPIGVGPTGAVSRAKVFGVAGFERQFAIKRFHPELTATAALAQALSSAARAYGSLEHPRIARMSEFGVAQGTTFTAVEFVSGLDALRLIAEVKMAGATIAPGGALALVSQAARAVGYAHGRGLTHLGLAPTNVMITADGDIKITDFGILAATLPPRPVEAQRLANRIAYLAPEQLANEATSAATDVFALGVLAYELVTGHRTFRGETPLQISQSVMAGPALEPPLPRPIVRVLQRCLARSPFERFPDARALADALDAALRVAPVPGTRKDIGAQVKQAMDRIAALHEGEMSGVLALNLGTGPLQRVSEPAGQLASPPAQRPPPAGIARGDEAVTREVPHLARQPAGAPASSVVSGLAAAAGAASPPGATVPDLPRAGAVSTVTGLPPMPIPVPQGVAPATIPSPPPVVAAAPQQPLGTSTLIGVPPHKLPPIGGSKPAVAIPSAAARPDAAGAARGDAPPARADAAAPSSGAVTRPSGFPRMPTPRPIPEALDRPETAAEAAEPARSPAPPVRPSEPPKPPGPRVRPGSEPAQPPPPPVRPSEPPRPPGPRVRPGSEPAQPPPPPGRPGAPPRPSAAQRIATAPSVGHDEPTRPHRVTEDLSGVQEVSMVEILPTGPSDDDADLDVATGTHDRAQLASAMRDAPGEAAPVASSERSPFDSLFDVPATSEPAGDAGMVDLAALTAAAARDTAAPAGQPPAPGQSQPTAAAADDEALGPQQTLLGFGSDEPESLTGGTVVERERPDFDEDPPRPDDHLPPSPIAPSGSRREPAPAPAPLTLQGSSEPQHLGGAAPEDERAPFAPAAAAPYSGGHVLPPPQGGAYPAEPAAHGYPPGPGQAGYPSAGGLAMHRDADAAAAPGAAPAGSRKRALLIVGGGVGAAALAVAGWFAYGAISQGGGASGGGGGGGGSTGGSQVASAGGSGGTAGGSAATAGGSATTAGGSAETAGSSATTAGSSAGGSAAGSAATAGGSAGSAGSATTAGSAATAPPDAGIAPDATPATDAAKTTGELAVVSTPPGARAFLDGADVGKTPLKLPGTADRHTIALLLPGHELYVAQVDGQGQFSIPLKKVTPEPDRAGIKVLHCKDAGRYYVFVDGKPSGQTCPTERINTTLGAHTVEIYDVVTETRRKWEINIKDGRISYRIRVDP